MRIFSTIAPGQVNDRKILEKSEKLSVYYHDLFDYPLTFSDLIKWDVSKTFTSKNEQFSISYQNNFYFLKGREGLIYKRALRERISTKKMEIAKKATKVLSTLPTILMVGVTGSLAMNNSEDESDIDLMVITEKGRLWTTRILAYILLLMFNFSLRSPNDKYQKNKLCLNIWMDESDLVWKSSNRNIYTAHEIAQILPLVNKNRSYEKLLYKNIWILKFWPNAVRIRKQLVKRKKHGFTVLIPNILFVIEKIAYKMQYLYMKDKITREVITPTRGIFHPQDLGNLVISHLDS